MGPPLYPLQLTQVWSLLLPLLTVSGITVLASSAATAMPVPVLAQLSSQSTLRLGSTGNSVRQVQALLSLLGYYESAIDGTYSPTTEAAVKAFQLDAGLTGDGIIGPATWDKLLPTPSTDLTPPPVGDGGTDASTAEADGEAEEQPVSLPTLKIGMRGPAIAQVQSALQELGFYRGPLDGIFGPGTEAAVIAFQESAQLSADGVVGPATWRALLQ